MRCSAVVAFALSTKVVLANKFGQEGCECVGIDVGNAVRPFPMIKVDDQPIGVTASFPPEMGTFCKAWDAGHHAKCNGAKDQPLFCEQKWCYVDPCKCNANITGSTYLPSWKYHKRPLHYSFETCGGNQDEWFKHAAVPRHATVGPAQCKEPEMGIGSPGCECVGISGRPGHITLMYGGKEGPYKAEIGSSCSLWENGAYPTCTVPDKDGNIPVWCQTTWCYIDACKCTGIAEAPRPTQKIAGSNFHGAPIYFSFNTCGGKYLLDDGWVEKSCWTMKSEKDCEGHKNLLGAQCGWLDGRCIDGELVPICSKEGHAKLSKDEL